MSGLADVIRKETIRSLVMRQIFCPVTDRVLDVRTCVVLNDRDGFPVNVLSQEGWQALTETQLAALAKRGVTVDESTVRP